MKYQYNLGISFYEVAEEHSGRIALKYPDGLCLNYDELNKLSNQIGNFLLDIGLVKGDVIAIFNEKSPIAYSLMLACLKTGIIYANLDVSSPWARIEKIVNNCQPKADIF